MQFARGPFSLQRSKAEDACSKTSSGRLLLTWGKTFVSIYLLGVDMTTPQLFMYSPVKNSSSCSCHHFYNSLSSLMGTLLRVTI